MEKLELVIPRGSRIFCRTIFSHESPNIFSAIIPCTRYMKLLYCQDWRRGTVGSWYLILRISESREDEVNRYQEKSWRGSPVRCTMISLTVTLLFKSLLKNSSSGR